MNITPAPPAARPRNLRRSNFADESESCFGSSVIASPLLGPDQLLQIGFGRTYVFQLLRTGNLALDGHCAAVLDFFQACNDARKVHLAFADRNFLAQLPGIGRPEPVFSVDTLYIRTEQLDRIHWIGLAVQNQIGEVEIDALIISADVLDRADQSNRCFLAGFVT